MRRARRFLLRQGLGGASATPGNDPARTNIPHSAFHPSNAHIGCDFLTFAPQNLHVIVGFVLIVLLGLELATGSFALLPLAVADHKLSAGRMLTNFGWVLLGNLIGSLLYAVLLTGALGMCGQSPDASGVAAKIVAIAQAKTTGYAKFGAAGLGTVLSVETLSVWLETLIVLFGRFAEPPGTCRMIRPKNT